MANQMLNEEDYKKILKLHLKKDVEYISIKKSNSQCNGFMGAYFILEIKYLDENETKIEKYFVKSMPGKSYQTQLAVNRNVYEKEKFYYNYLIKEYEDYGFDVSFAPKFYYCKGSLLVMEYLSEEKYKLTDVNDYTDIDQVKMALKAIALFHCASIMYEEKMSEKLGYTFRLNEKYSKLFEENLFNIEKNTGFCKELYDMVTRFLHFIIDNNNGRYKPEFKEYITPDILLAGVRKRTNFRKVTGHGDLWCNNIFLQTKNFVKQELNCKIIDYQVLRYSEPAFDVSLFIHLNCSKEFRKQNMKTLLHYYYSTMEETLSNHGYDISLILPVEEFEKSLKFVQTTVIYQTLTMGTVTFMPLELTQKMVDIFSEDNSWCNKIYEFIKEGYFSNDKYKTLIMDTVDDLHDSIFGKNYVPYFS